MTQNRSDIIRPLAIFAVAISLGFAHLWVRTQHVTQGYQINELKRAKIELEAQITELKLKKSRQLSPANLEHYLKTLQSKGSTLAEPKNDQVFFVDAAQTEAI